MAARLLALVGLAALAAPLAATAASLPTHLERVTIPDGSILAIRYAGTVAPRLVLEPEATPIGWVSPPFMPSAATLMANVAAMMEAADTDALRAAAAPASLTPAVFADPRACVTETRFVDAAGRTPTVTTFRSAGCGSRMPAGANVAVPVRPRPIGQHLIEASLQTPEG